MRVVVTRPQPQADATAAKLRDLGHEPIILPLTEIVPVAPAAIGEGDFVAVTSANALRNADTALLLQLIRLPLFAVGDRTAAIAGDAGFSDVKSANGDVDALAKLVLESTAVDSRAIYLCGRPRRPDFEGALAQAGRALIAVETYETRALAIESIPSDADVVLVYARSAVDALNAMGGIPLNATFICISQRVAEALDALPERIRVAARPDGASMLAEIARLR
jgi:uroporphyrinogen-III synthase